MTLRCFAVKPCKQDSRVLRSIYLYALGAVEWMGYLDIIPGRQAAVPAASVCWHLSGGPRAQLQKRQELVHAAAVARL